MSEGTKASLEERLRRHLVDRRVVAALFSTYTFSRAFFDGVVMGMITNEGDRLGRFPVTVIVDRDQFSGQGKGYGVVCPPQGRTWHAKLTLLWCASGDKRSTILAVGSGNLTTAGWERNQEVFRVSVHDGWRIPPCIREWFDTGSLATSAVGVWIQRVERAKGQLRLRNLNGSAAGRLLGSWSKPIWQQAAVARGKRWSEAHVVAPYSERKLNEDGPAAEPVGFFARLADAAAPEADLHVYLAGAPGAGNEHTVIGFRDVFVKKLPKLGLRVSYHRVTPVDRRQLHAKIYAFKRGQAWTMLVGSPNASGTALTKRGGNIELAFELRHAGRTLPIGLLPADEKLVPLGQLRFQAPDDRQAMRWHALASARYDARRKRVILSWLTGRSFANTSVWWGQQRVAKGTAIDLSSSDLRCLETRPLGDRTGFVSAYVPLEVPADYFDGECGSADLSPDGWLDALGTAQISRRPTRLGGKGIWAKGNEAKRPGAFEWRLRVLHLLDRLAWVRFSVGDVESAQDVDRLTRLLEGAWDAHDPEASVAAEERAWREWVRAGLWQALSGIDGRVTITRPLGALRKRWTSTVRRHIREYPIA